MIGQAESSEIASLAMTGLVNISGMDTTAFGGAGGQCVAQTYKMVVTIRESSANDGRNSETTGLDTTRDSSCGVHDCWRLYHDCDRVLLSWQSQKGGRAVFKWS